MPVAVTLTAGLTAWLDPFFHYHAPLSGFYYMLDNERAQNDGITKRFSYQALITGTSLTQNFKTSELEALFGVQAVKVCYAGSPMKETADNLRVALATHEVKMVVRDLYEEMLLWDKDRLLDSAGEYPVWLYNDNPFDDVRYLLNMDVLVDYCAPMLVKKISGMPGGIMTFDDYSRWMSDNVELGKRVVLQKAGPLSNGVEQTPLTDEEKNVLKENLRQNAGEPAARYPDTMFYYFFPPYSVASWGKAFTSGEALRRLEVQELTIKELLPYDNIKLFAFGINTGITEDFDNYRDPEHYTDRINSMILEEMANPDSVYRITAENANAYLGEMKRIYLTYDYESLWKE